MPDKIRPFARVECEGCQKIAPYGYATCTGWKIFWDKSLVVGALCAECQDEDAKIAA
jgi:hypothetical protein